MNLVYLNLSGNRLFEKGKFNFAKTLLKILPQTSIGSLDLRDNGKPPEDFLQQLQEA